jgi:Na+-transporting NADH:ubiquinone oxidoreductase subunit NqrC
VAFLIKNKAYNLSSRFLVKRGSHTYYISFLLIVVNGFVIYSTYSAFVAVKADGSIVAWGDSRFGGTTPAAKPPPVE